MPLEALSSQFAVRSSQLEAFSGRTIDMSDAKALQKREYHVKGNGWKVGKASREGGRDKRAGRWGPRVARVNANAVNVNFGLVMSV